MPLDSNQIYIDIFYIKFFCPHMLFFLSIFTLFHKKCLKVMNDIIRTAPHNGYCYGRWNYGHWHFHGCDFGGNCGGDD